MSVTHFFSFLLPSCPSLPYVFLIPPTLRSNLFLAQRRRPYLISVPSIPDAANSSLDPPEEKAQHPKKWISGSIAWWWRQAPWNSPMAQR